MSKKSIMKLSIDKLHKVFNDLFTKQLKIFYEVYEQFKKISGFDELNVNIEQKQEITPDIRTVYIHLKFNINEKILSFLLPPPNTSGYKDIYAGYSTDFDKLDKGQRIALYKFNVLKALYLVKNYTEFYQVNIIPCKETTNISTQLNKYLKEVSLQCLKEVLPEYFNFEEVISLLDALLVVDPEFCSRMDLEELKKQYKLEEEKGEK
jgi:hypothetical protein